MRRLGVSIFIAVVLSTWFLASPTFILYEQWLYYQFPLALLMTLSCLLLSHTLTRPRFREAFGFFGVVCAMCLLHSSFHLLYFLLVMTTLLALRWGHRRIIVAAALLPLLLLLGLYTKNYLLFGQLTTSSWSGMNFARVTLKAMPLEARRQLVEEGKLSPLALIRPFSNLEDYPARFRQVRGFEQIPALRQAAKPPYWSNFNHLAYLSISRTYLKDDLYVVFHRPKYLLLGWLNSWICYFRSGSDYSPTYGNLSKIGPVNVLYDYAFYGKVPHYRLHLGVVPAYYIFNDGARLYLFLLIGLPLLLLFGFRTAWRPSWPRVDSHA